MTATEEVHEQYRSLVRGVGAGWFAACQWRRRSQGHVVVALDRRMPQHPGRPQVPFLFVLPTPPPRSAGRGGEKVGLLVKLVTSETDMLKKCETCYKCD